MLRKFGIYIGALLFVVALFGNAGATGDRISARQVAFSAPAPCKDPGFKFKKSDHRNDWIKVRYMGGDCSFGVPVFPVSIDVPVYFDVFVSEGYRSFISSSVHFLFKLRGPPAVA